MKTNIKKTVEQKENEVMRLSKWLAHNDYCSRREAEEWILRGWLKVNGETITELGTKVGPDDKIQVSEEALKDQDQLVTIILNKPLGYVSAQVEGGYEDARSLLVDSRYYDNSKTNRKPVKALELDQLAVTGRLDIDSRGLLIFTQDGRLAKKIIGENSNIEKEYIINVVGEITEEKLQLLRHGLELDGEKLKPAGIKLMRPQVIQFILKQGKKRQIRRMCELVDLRVTRLERVRVGKLKLGNLPEGEWRLLEPWEEI